MTRYRPSLILLCLLAGIGFVAGCGTNITLNKPIPAAALEALNPLAAPPRDGSRWPCFQRDGLHRGWQEVSRIPDSFSTAWTFKLQDLVFEFVEGISVFSRNAVVIPRAGRALVITGCFDRNVYALDLQTGRREWTRSTSGPVSASPVVSEDGQRVFISSGDRSIYCLSADDGSVVWKYETMPWSYTSYASVAGEPAFFRWNGREYLAAPMYNADRKAVRNYRDGSIYLLDAGDGTLVKKITITDSPLSGLVVIPGKTALIGIGAAHSGTLYAVDLITGSFFWQRVLAGRIGGTPSLVKVNGDWRLLVGDSFGTAWVLNPSDGSLVWSKKTGLFINASIAAYPPGNLIAVASEDRFVHCFDLVSGEPRGRFETGKYLNAAPLFLTAGDSVTALVASQDEKLYWVDLPEMKARQVFKTSPLRWNYEKRASATWTSPQAVELDGAVYLLYGDMGGTFHCYKAEFE